MDGIWKPPGTETTDAGALSAFGFDTIAETRLTMVDPAVSETQRRFAGAELARKRAGKKTRSGMTEEQLRDFAKKPKGGG